MMEEKKKKKTSWDIPFQIAWEDEVLELQKKKERIQQLMEFIKEEWLEDDKEFMKEVQDAIEQSL